MAEPTADADLPSFCRELGLPGLADVHVHFMPSWLMQRIWVHFDRAGETVGVEWPVRYRWSDGERVTHLRRLGVHLFTALAYAHRPGLAADPVGNEHTGPDPVRALLSRHPRLAFVVAHLGMPDYAAFLDLAERYERVALDTTLLCTPYAERAAPFPERLLPRLRDLGLAGKVLLGSDFPNIAWPYAAQVAGLVRLGLGDAWLRAVCWQNALKLFRPAWPDGGP